MKSQSNLLLIYVLQFLSLLVFPPATLIGGWWAVLVVLAVFALLGIGLRRGNPAALYMSMFLQGFNVIVRLMMLFPHARLSDAQGGGFDVLFIATSLIAIAASSWFLQRLDRPDVRATIRF